MASVQSISICNPIATCSNSRDAMGQGGSSNTHVQPDYTCIHTTAKCMTSVLPYQSGARMGQHVTLHRSSSPAMESVPNYSTKSPVT
jgi:hypothetical protein